MIGVVLKGGLGNTLFQWALGCAFEKRGKRVVYNNSLLEPGRGRLYLLDKLGLDLPIRNDWIGPIIEEQSLRYNPDIFMFDEIILNGFWQCEKYFLDVQDWIREKVFRDTLFSGRTLQLAGEILGLQDKSCFVHVRRTDNLRPAGLTVHGLLTSEDSQYYQRAMNLMRESVPDVRFFIFSDDPQWVHEHWGSGKFATVVDHNTMSGYTDENHEMHDRAGGTEHEDLWLMSLCRHAIIANSSFSWWGAWLNPKQENRVVIAPQPWFATLELDSTDIIPERWEKVKIR